MDKTCAMCGVAFTASGRNASMQKYCTERCRQRVANYKQGIVSKKYFEEFGKPKQCALCGKEFIPKTARTRFCDRRCEKRSQYNHEIHLYRTYGIGTRDYAVLLEAQNGLCAICKKPYTEEAHQKLSVDHNHATNKLRGLLCNGCNVHLGWYEKWRTEANKYLDAYDNP